MSSWRQPPPFRRKQVRRKLRVIWDGLPRHRRRTVKDYLAAPKGKLAVEFLPAYAPELNPVEYWWGHGKQPEIPNCCPQDFSPFARQTLRRMRRRPVLVIAFWKKAGLFADRHYIG